MIQKISDLFANIYVSDLTVFDYGAFLLVFCNKGQKTDLQILQNNALRLCLRFRLADRKTESRLHSEGTLLRLEQRGN